MKHKIKNRICEAAALLGAVGVFLAVGAVENFTISLRTGAGIMAAFAAMAVTAVYVGCKEG